MRVRAALYTLRGCAFLPPGPSVTCAVGGCTLMDGHLKVIADLYHALVRGYTNEVSIDQKEAPGGSATFDDPVKLRFGAYRPADGRRSFYLGAISMDVLEADGPEPRRREKGFIALKLDPDPVIEVFLQKRADTTEDRDMVLVFSVSEDYCEFHVPVRGLPTTAPSRVTRVYTDDGRYCYNFQGPSSGQPLGAGIKYDTHGSADGSTWTAVGRIVEGPL